jgi:hypothetical protein
MLTFSVIALAALGIAIGSWFRPLPSTKTAALPASSYTDQQVASAKAHVCAAFGNVDHALHLADGRGGSSNDPTAQLAVATSTRQVLDAGSRYLLTKLEEEPATPPELSTAVKKQANAYQEVLIYYLAGLTYSDPVLKSAGNDSNEETASIQRLCK